MLQYVVMLSIGLVHKITVRPMSDYRFNIQLHPALYARHALESVGLKKSKNCQKGWVQRIFNIKGVLIKKSVARVELLTLTK